MADTMNRSPLVTVTIVLQLLLGSLLAGLSIYVLTLTRSPETLADPDSAGTIHGLLIGAAVLGVPALVTLVAVWGLWTRSFWGWVLSLATDVGTLGVMVYSMMDEGNWEPAEIGVFAACVVPIVLLLLPAMRKFYWNPATSVQLRKG